LTPVSQQTSDGVPHPTDKHGTEATSAKQLDLDLTLRVSDNSELASNEFGDKQSQSAVHNLYDQHLLSQDEYRSSLYQPDSPGQHRETHKRKNIVDCGANINQCDSKCDSKEQEQQEQENF